MILLPYGQLLANQQVTGSTYDERYKFTGKERDEETGYDYFGARYYVPEIPIWLSVDPLADKYPNISPYAYAAWNPIKYVDPDGMENVVALPNPAEEKKQVIQSYESNGDVIHFLRMGNKIAYKYRAKEIEKREDISLVQNNLIYFYCQIVKYGRKKRRQKMAGMQS